MKTRNRLLIACLPVLLLVFTVQPASAVGILPSASSWALNLDGTLFDSLGSPIGFPLTGGGLTGMAPTIEALHAAGYLGLTENGSTFLPDVLPQTPGYTDGTTFVTSTTVSFKVTGAGLHDILAFFDNDFLAPGNSYDNEYAQIFNLGPSPFRWEVDEPGYTHGDLYSGGTGPHTSFCHDGVTLGCDSHVEQGSTSLEDNNEISDPQNPDDVSVGMGWHFTLARGETATLSFTQTLTDPRLSSLYIGQFDDGDPTTALYYYTDMQITSSPVPEPATALLLLLGVSAIGAGAQFKTRKA